MELLLILLDVLIYNLTSCNSYFFLISIYLCLYYKKYKLLSFICLIVLALTMDYNFIFIIFSYILIYFLINRKSSVSLSKYLIINITGLIIMLGYINKTNILYDFIFNLIFIIISYKYIKIYIKLFG